MQEYFLLSDVLGTGKQQSSLVLARFFSTSAPHSRRLEQAEDYSYLE